MKPDLEFLIQLRGIGVQSFEFTNAEKVPDWKVTFFPSSPEAQKPSMDEAAPYCKCGHSEAEHNDQNLCLQGCAADACEIK